MSKNKSINTYAGIKTYEGLKGLRHRRSMYLGNTGLLEEGRSPDALIQTVQEVVSNSIDEFLGGYGQLIDVTIHKDNSVTIKDNGRGMPKGPNEEFTDVIASLTKPHSSGKFEGSGYDATGVAGMNGIGLKATNATSRYMKLHAISHSTTLNQHDVEPILDGGYEEYFIHLNQEEIVEKKLIRKWSSDEVEQLSGTSFKVKETGEEIHTGTTISYLPDDGPTFEEDDNPVFESIDWVVADLQPRFDSSAFLNGGLIIHFTDERTELEDTVDEDGNVIKPKTQYYEESWYYERGLTEYVEKLIEYQTLLSKFKTPISFDEEMEYEGMNFRLQASLIVTDDIDTNLKTYANGVPTPDGGPHLDGFQTGLTKAINEYAKDRELNKVKVSKTKTKQLDSFKVSDVLEGLTGVFEIRIPSKIADFIGQTKEKLATSQAKPVTYELTYKNVSDWLYDNEDAAKQMIEKIIESKTAREAAITARQEAKKARQSKGSVEKLIELSKLKKATGNDPRKNELYIVEGDSASGGDLDSRYQGMLPLRGKIKNVEEITLSEALANDEISSLTSALGTGIGPAFNIDDLLYYKLIISCFTGDTKVKSLDGKSYSFKELVDNNINELWVYSQDRDGNMVPALAKNIRKTGTSKTLVQLTLDNGEIVKATPDHFFLTVDGKYVQAQDLSVNDRLMSLHTQINQDGYEEYFDQNSSQWIKTYRRVAEFVNDEDRQQAYKRLENEDPSQHAFQRTIQVHHDNENKLDNRPINLKWLTTKEHFSEHARRTINQYNGSEKQKEDLRAAHKSGKYDQSYFGNNGYNGSDKHIEDVKKAHAEGKYTHVYFGQNGWNGSEAQREVTRRNNSTQKHIDSVKRGKILVSIKFLQMMNLPFDEYHYDFYRNIGAVRYKNILNVFDSYEEAYDAAKSYEYHEYQKAHEYTFSYDVNKKQKTQIAKVIKSLIESEVEFNESSYNSTNGGRTPNYKNILKYFESYDDAFEYAKHLNHKIIDIQILDFEDEQDVYCLTVDNYHNFLLDSGIYVKNCDADSDGKHISMLLITLLHRFFRPLIENGHVFTTIPPLYKATKYIKGEPTTKFFYSDEEMNNVKDELLSEGYNIQRFKGLGEMNDDEVTYTLLDPETRIIKRLTIEDAEVVRQKLRILMGDKAELRKQWVAQNVDYDELYEKL